MTCVLISDGVVCFEDRKDCVWCAGTGECSGCLGYGCEFCEESGFCSFCGGTGLEPEEKKSE